MPIQVQHQPDPRLLAGAGYAAGLGQYSQAYNEFLQPERMQLNQIGSSEFQQGRGILASAAMQQQRIAAQQQQQAASQQFKAAQEAQQRAFQGRQAGFNRLEGFLGRQQQAGIQQAAEANRYRMMGDLRTADFQNRFAGNTAKGIFDAAQAWRLQNAQQLDPQSRDELTQLMNDGMDLLADPNILPPVKAKKMAGWQQKVAAFQQKAVPPVDPQQQFQEEVLWQPDPGRPGVQVPWVRDPDGQWQVPRGYSIPDLEGGQVDPIKQAEMEHKQQQDMRKQQIELADKRGKFVASIIGKVKKKGDVDTGDEVYTAEEAWAMADRLFPGQGGQPPPEPPPGIDLPFVGNVPIPGQPTPAPPPIEQGPIPDPMFSGQGGQPTPAPPQQQPAQQQQPIDFTKVRMPEPVALTTHRTDYPERITTGIKRIFAQEMQVLPIATQQMEALKASQQGKTRGKHLSPYDAPAVRIYAALRQMRDLLERHGHLSRDKWPKKAVERFTEAAAIVHARD